MAATTAQPFSDAQLEKITKDACNSTLASATAYVHASTESWNTAIINEILKGVLSAAPTTTESSPASTSSRPQYKYAVNSTIIQHLSEPVTTKATTTTNAGTSTEEAAQQASPPGTPKLGASSSTDPERGRRGMHSATGAYWNNDTDGMWSHKWEGGEGKGMDVVVSVIWVSVS